MIALGVCLYANSIHNSFHFDDYYYVLGNSALTDITDIPRIWRAHSHPARFVTFMTFALNYYFHGWEVEGYHFVNIGLHILNSFFDYQ